MEKLLQKNNIEFKAERARFPPLTRILMSGEMNGSGAKELTAKQKFDRW
jgi:NADPH oxidase